MILPCFPHIYRHNHFSFVWVIDYAIYRLLLAFPFHRDSWLFLTFVIVCVLTWQTNMILTDIWDRILLPASSSPSILFWPHLSLCANGTTFFCPLLNPQGQSRLSPLSNQQRYSICPRPSSHSMAPLWSCPPPAPSLLFPCTLCPHSARNQFITSQLKLSPQFHCEFITLR